MTETLFNNTDGIISYVTSKIEKYEPNRFEEQVKYYINHYCEKYLKVKIPAQHINNFYIIHYLTIRDIVKDEEHRREVEMERERMADYEEAVRIAREDLMSKVYKNQNETGKKAAYDLKSFRPLLEEDKQKIYLEYKKAWDEAHPKKEKPKKPKEKSFKERLDEYVILHNGDNELLTFEDFVKLTEGWKRGKKSLESWYKEYQDKYFQQPGATIEIPNVELTGLFGFKGKDKIKALKLLNPELKEEKGKITSSFPLKENIKRFQLHRVAERNTWMIDLMEIYIKKKQPLKYLIAINVNTKYLYAQILNVMLSKTEFSKDKLKATMSYLRALQKLIDKGMKVEHLIGDGEGAFKSDESKMFYETHNISFSPVERQPKGAYPDFMKYEQKKAKKTEPLHSSLGIVDRVIRTIRDMAYNMNIGVITPEVMDEIVNQYNNAPHRGLSKWAGFSVTPKMVNDDPELENYIVRRILQANWEIKNNASFNINDGVNVKVYNMTDNKMKRRSVIRPGEFKVIGKKNGLYEVEGKLNGENETQLLPRYLLDPI